MYNINPRNRIITFATLFLIALSVIALNSPSVQADSTQKGYYWTLLFDLTVSPDAVLEISMGPWDPDTRRVEEPLITRHYTISCTPVGVFPGGDYTNFAGNNHIVCNLDLATHLSSIYRDCVDLFGEGGCLSPPVDEDTYGWLSMRASARYLGGVNAHPIPLFYHEDAQLALDATSGPSRIIYGVTKEGGSFITEMSGYLPESLGLLQPFTVIYNCLARYGPVGCASQYYALNYIENGPLNLDSTIEFSLQPRRIYVGYNPDTNTHFLGQIQQVGVDPGAFGSGGG